jgi:ligand-binding sensor domain-containing protein
MPGGLITALEHDHQGNLWIGTIEGIRVLRGDHVQSIDLAPMGGGRSVFGFHQLGDAMWISSDRGLYRWRNGALARVGLEQGMPVDAVFQLVPDRLGNVWISSNRGVLRTDMATLNAVADGRTPRWWWSATTRSTAWPMHRPMAAPVHRRSCARMARSGWSPPVA